MLIYICYLLAGRSVDRQTDPKPVNNLFIFSKLSNDKNSRKKTHTSVTVAVVRDRKIRTALRTNQIAGFVTVPAWKKIKYIYFMTSNQLLRGLLTTINQSVYKICSQILCTGKYLTKLAQDHTGKISAY